MRQALRHTWLVTVMAAGLGATAQSPRALENHPAAPDLLTLDAAVTQGLQHQPDLQLAGARVHAAEARVAEARAAFYPQISLTGIIKAGLPGSAGALGLVGFPATPFFRNIAGSLNIQQSIFDFGRLRHTLRAQKLLQQAAALQQTVAQRTVTLLIVRSYRLALTAGYMRDLAEDEMALRCLDREEAQAFARVGLRSEFKTTVADEQFAQAQAAKTQSSQAEDAAKVALRVAMGLQDIASPMTLVAPALQLPPVPLPGNIAEAMTLAQSNRPELQAEALEANALAQQVQVAQADRLPQVGGFGAAGSGRFNDATVKPEQQHGVAAIGASLPVFDGGLRKARIREAVAEVQAEQARGDQLRQSIAREVTDLVLQNASAVMTLELLHQQESLAEAELQGVTAQVEARILAPAARVRAEMRLRQLRVRIAVAHLAQDQVLFESAFSLGQNLPI
jgi:outer membrane protein